jgi:hypothetical protein
MTAEDLIAPTRTIIEELAFRRRQNPGRREDDLMLALVPMVQAHRADIESGTDAGIAWVNALGVALLLTFPGWSADRCVATIQDAAVLADGGAG